MTNPLFSYPTLYRGRVWLLGAAADIPVHPCARDRLSMQTWRYRVTEHQHPPLTRHHLLSLQSSHRVYVPDTLWGTLPHIPTKGAYISAPQAYSLVGVKQLIVWSAFLPSPRDGEHLFTRSLESGFLPVTLREETSRSQLLPFTHLSEFPTCSVTYVCCKYFPNDSFITVFMVSLAI